MTAVEPAKEAGTTEIPTSASLDMRGKSITTYIAYNAWQQLAKLDKGQSLELLTGTGDAINNDLRAWCHAAGHQLSVEQEATQARYVITKGAAAPSGRRFAAVISDPGLEELLSPLGFALAAGLEGIDVSLYFQGPAVRVLSKGFAEKLHGWSRPFSRFARAGLVKAGHIAAQDKLRQLQALGARLYACGPSMQHFHVARSDLAFGDVTVAEYLTFTEVLANADIQLFVQ